MGNHAWRWSNSNAVSTGLRFACILILRALLYGLRDLHAKSFGPPKWSPQLETSYPGHEPRSSRTLRIRKSCPCQNTRPHTPKCPQQQAIQPGSFNRTSNSPNNSGPSLESFCRAPGRCVPLTRKARGRGAPHAALILCKGFPVTCRAIPNLSTTYSHPPDPVDPLQSPKQTLRVVDQAVLRWVV